MAEEELGIRLRANGVVETTKGFDLTGDASDRLGNRLDNVSKKLPDMAKGSREAASGANVLSGALREAANEATAGLPVPAAMRTAVLGMGGAFGIAATAALVLGSAYVQGNQEASAYRSAIVLTGNAAGVTTGMLADMARGVRQLGAGTQSEAAALLARLTASGQVAREHLQQVTQQALQLQQVGGVAVDTTIRNFVRLGESPVKASVELNKTTNFLTVSLYEQIRALEKQGRASEAAALAQHALLDATKPRIEELVKQVGWVEQGWLGVLGAVKSVKDALLDLGREQTLQQQLDAVNQALSLPVQRGRDPLQAEQRREALRQRQAELQELQRLERRSTDLQAAQAAATRDAIAAREKERDKKPGPDPADRLEDSIQRRLALAQAELAAGDQLSQADRFRIELLREIDEVQGKIGQRRAEQLRSEVESTTRQMRAVEAQREELKAREQLERQFAAERDAATKAAYAERERMEQRNAALADETAAVGMSSEGLQARRQAQTDAEIADRSAPVARIDGRPAYAEEATALRQQIDLLERRKGLQQDKYVVETRQKELEENKQRQEGLADSITDGIMEGFRDGATYAEIFRRELQAQFANLVLRPSIQYLVDQAWDGGNGGPVGGLLGLLGVNLGGGGSIASSVGYGIPMGVPLAKGGRAERGSLHPINEVGPEVISVGNRSYLMMGAQDGQVTPAARGGGSSGGGGRSVVQNVSIRIDGTADRAETVALIQRAMQQSKAELVEMMDRNQV
jgi:phage-related minor tail protein